MRQKKLSTIDLNEVISTIKTTALLGFDNTLHEAFGVNMKESYDIITPEQWNAVMNTPGTKAIRIARILEYIQTKANSSEEAVYIFYTLISFLAEMNGKQDLLKKLN